MYKRILLVIALFISFAISSIAQIPIKSNSLVNDYAKLLTADQVSNLETILKTEESKTSNQVAVVTVNDLNGQDIETYANTLFRSWGIGQKDKNNGVLLLVSKVDREIRIEVGYGLEGALTDLESKMIVDQMISSFKENDYYAGILDGVNGIITAIEGEFTSNTSIPIKIDPYYIFFLLVFFVPILGEVMSTSKSIILGGVLGGVVGGILFWQFSNVSLIIGGILTGLIIDYILSNFVDPKIFKKSKRPGFVGYLSDMNSWSNFGGGSGGGTRFGGGSSGGGGASGKW